MISPNNPPSPTGTVDYDIIVHLGTLRNVDMSSRGVYMIHLTLLYGYDMRCLISPVGIFSAPSTLDSFVDEQRVASPPMDRMQPAGIDSQQQFQSRSFVVRYANEYFELNEGVKFRMSHPFQPSELPSLNQQSLTAPEPVVVKVDLLCCKLLQAEGDVRDIDPFLPPDPVVFDTVATQSLRVPRVHSGLHEFFPIWFERGNFINLDVMIHIGANVRLELPNELLLERSKQQEEAKPETKEEEVYTVQGTVISTDLSSSTDLNGSFSKRAVESTDVLSVGRDKIGMRGLTNTSASEVVRKLAQLKASTSFFYGGLTSSSSSSSPSSSSPSSYGGLSPWGISPEELLRNFSFSSSNLLQLQESTRVFFNMYLSSSYGVLLEGRLTEEDIYAEDLLLLEYNQQKHRQNPSTEEELAVLSKMKTASTSVELRDILQRYIESVSQKTSALWAEFVSMLPTIAAAVRSHLRPRYCIRMRGFWKLQMITNTLGSSNITRPNMDEDVHFKRLREEIEREGAVGQQLLQYARSISPAEGSDPWLPLLTRYFARGLPVYDKDVHEDLSKLPQFFLQQYISPLIDPALAPLTAQGGLLLGCQDDISVLKEESKGICSYSYSFSSCPFFDPTSSPNNISIGRKREINPCSPSPPSSPRSVHLIVLQHGFEGHSYDMRHLRNYLQVVLPHARVFVPTSNEGLTNDSIDTMGNRMAEEVASYIWREFRSTKLSDMKISFFGHSMGGLVVRRAIEEQVFAKYLTALHCYISLATPHLGTRYSDSKLVSTGIWAVTKWTR
jgi:Putative serine esterase (DUF676)/Protein FAM135